MIIAIYNLHILLYRCFAIMPLARVSRLFMRHIWILRSRSIRELELWHVLATFSISANAKDMTSALDFPPRRSSRLKNSQPTRCVLYSTCPVHRGRFFLEILTQCSQFTFKTLHCDHIKISCGTPVVSSHACAISRNSRKLIPKIDPQKVPYVLILCIFGMFFQN